MDAASEIRSLFADPDAMPGLDAVRIRGEAERIELEGLRTRLFLGQGEEESLALEALDEARERLETLRESLRPELERLAALTVPQPTADSSSLAPEL